MSELTLSGLFFDGQTSHCHPATMVSDANGNVSLSVSNGINLHNHIHELNISHRIGNTPRYITFPNGERFQTHDNTSLDTLTKSFNQHPSRFNAHIWETKYRYIAMASLAFLLTVVAMMKYGIPALSEKIAMDVSPDVSIYLANEVIDKLDAVYLSTSTLSTERQKELTLEFTRYIPDDAEFQYRLFFRKGGIIGANALALPDGSAVITDELIALADNNEEIIAVLLHEIGHVQHRHGLRQAIEGFSLYALYAMITGDIGASSPLILYIPAVLTQAKYSRNHEIEADNYALNSMRQYNIDPIHFANIMQKLSEHKQEKEKEKESIDVNTSPENQNTSRGINQLLEYLSSHPPSAERINTFKNASTQWRLAKPSTSE